MRKALIAGLMSLTMVASFGLSAFAGETEAEAVDETAITVDTSAYAKERPEGGYVFAYTCMDGSNPFFVTIEDEIRAKLAENGDTLISSDPANDVTRQISQMEDAIAQQPDGYFVNPAEAEGIIPALDQVKDAGIPIVNFDTEVADKEDYIVAYTGSDNYNAGKVCGEDLVAQCPDGGDIIVLDSPTMNSVVDRTNGFLDAIEGHGFNIVAQQDAKGNLQEAQTICDDLLQAHPDVVAIFGGNDPTALGILASAEGFGLKNVLIYGVDGSPDFKAEMSKEGSLLRATGAQSPISIADKAVEIMYDIMEGKEVQFRYPVETFLITPDNVADYGTDGWQ
jgi:ribose transport system substrate-binding protein